jgi:hypothetical protein
LSAFLGPDALPCAFELFRRMKGVMSCPSQFLLLLFGAVMVAGLNTASMVGIAQQTDKSTQAGAAEDQAEDADEPGDKDVADNPEGSADYDADTGEDEKTDN